MTTTGKSRLAMRGNQNGLKEITKDDRFQTRINGEDKIRLEAYCKANKLTLSEYLITSMVDAGILSEDRRPKKKAD